MISRIFYINMFLLISLFCSTLILVIKTADAQEPPPKANLSNADFAFTCDVKCKRHGLDAIPTICKSIATSNHTFDYIEEVLKLRTKTMKFMRTIDDISYDNWLGFMRDDNKVKEVTDSIEKFKIDAIVFDNMYKVSDDPPNPEINNQILDFHTKILKKAPNVLFGLRLPKDHIDKAFDLNIITKCVNFYVVNSYDYNICNLYPVDMRNTQNKNLEDTIDDLRKSGYPLDKVLLSLDIAAYTKKKRSKSRTQMTFTEVCRDKKSIYRFFCLDKMEQFYDKAHLIVENQMMGLYVRWADYDDWKGSCGCEDENKATTFPILKVLEKGRLGEPKEGPLIKCKPRIKQ